MLNQNGYGHKKSQKIWGHGSISCATQMTLIGIMLVAKRAHRQPLEVQKIHAKQQNLLVEQAFGKLK